jgi:glycosyltransferase involved in cell wall biosynthesis
MADRQLRELKVAIVHDWLYGGGAERVVFELHKMFPEAPIYTSYCSDEWREKLDGKVVTGFLQRWPFSKLRKFLPVLRIWWFTHLNFTGYDLVISSSGNGEAKGVKVPKGTTHVCYCHTPTHFYWRHYSQYIQQPGFGVFNPLARFGLRLLVGPLRRWDLKAAKRPDFFIANSTQIKADIKQYYGREAVVIFPPVDVARFTGAKAPERYGYVTMGRQVPYKRFDLVIEASSQLGIPLKVIGRGPDHERLVKLAGSNVDFLTDVTDEEMPTQLAGAYAFLYAAEEDFGIAPPEAMAAGTPVIAYKAGGALDYVTPGKTGEFYDPQTSQALINALRKFDPLTYNHSEIAESAQRFSSDMFVQKMEDFLQNTCLKP